MKDIELQTEAFKRYIEECDELSITPDYASAFNAAWNARAAVEADRAQRVPEGYSEDQIAQAAMEAEIPDSKLESLLIALASTPAQPAQQEPDCPRCNGSGEDPEGYFDQSHGPDGDTHDGPCRDCAGTGATPQPVERKPMTITPVAQAMEMYAKYPTYRGTRPLSWFEAPQEVRDEWIKKAAHGIRE